MPAQRPSTAIEADAEPDTDADAKTDPRSLLVDVAASLRALLAGTGTDTGSDSAASTGTGATGTGASESSSTDTTDAVIKALTGSIHRGLMQARAEADDDIPAEFVAVSDIIRALLPTGIEDGLAPRIAVLLRLMRRGAVSPAWMLLHDNASGRVRPTRTRSGWAGGTVLHSALPLPTVVDSGSVYAWLPGFRDPRYGVPDEVYRLDSGVRLRHSLDSVVMGDDALELSGTGFITMLDADPEDEIRLIFEDVDGRRHRLRANRARRPDLTTPRGPDLTHLAWGGWQVRVPLRSLAKRPGRWAVSIEVTQQGIRRTAPLGAHRGALAGRRLVDGLNGSCGRILGERATITIDSVETTRADNDQLRASVQRARAPWPAPRHRAPGADTGRVRERRHTRHGIFGRRVTDPRAHDPVAAASPGGGVKVSVVIPVWNPGPSLARCIESVTQQTMSPHNYEIICVDDGSSDGTADRLDALAEQHHQLRVIHTPNSGWPGAPRNIGLDAARGEYIHFVDNDDVLPADALMALYTAAQADGADVVCGRPVSNFRRLNYAIYRRDLRGVTLADHPELMDTLTPHRMFRRSLLTRGDGLGPIRYPEGRVPLEDQFFVLRAYAAATSVTLLADRPYYYYLRRAGSGRNAGDRPVDVAPLIDSVKQLLDLVDVVAADAPGVREHFYLRTLRLVVIPRIASPALMASDPHWFRAMLDEVRRLTDGRLGGLGGAAIGGLGGAAIGGLGAAQRVVATLAAADQASEDRARSAAAGGDGASAGSAQGAGSGTGSAERAIEHAAREIAAVSLTASVGYMTWIDPDGHPALEVQIDGHLTRHGEELRLTRIAELGTSAPLGSRGISPHWALPEAMADVSASARTIGLGADPADAEVLLTHRASGLTYGITDGLTVWIEERGTSAGQVRVGGRIVIDPYRAGGTTAHPAPLEDGVWDVTLQLRFEGINRRCAVQVDAERLANPMLGKATSVWPHRTNSAGALGLDIGAWIRTTAGRVAPSAEITATDDGLHLAVDATLERVDGRADCHAGDGRGAGRADRQPGDGRSVEVILVPNTTTSGGSIRLRGRLHHPSETDPAAPDDRATVTVPLPDSCGGARLPGSCGADRRRTSGTPGKQRTPGVQATPGKQGTPGTPEDESDGTWRVWLRVAPEARPADPPTRLQWTVRRRAGNVTVSKVQTPSE